MGLKGNYNTLPFDFFFLSCQFTERTVRKEALKCELSMKIFGNELSFLNCEDLRKQMKHYSLNLAELAVRLLKVKGTFFLSESKYLEKLPSDRYVKDTKCYLLFL